MILLTHYYSKEAKYKLSKYSTCFEQQFTPGLKIVNKQGSSENDGISNVYDSSELKVISNCCYTNCCFPNCCHTNFGNVTWIYLFFSEFTIIHLILPKFLWFTRSYQCLPEFTLIYLNLSKYDWIYLFLPVFICIYLNLPALTCTYIILPQYTWIYLNSP